MKHKSWWHLRNNFSSRHGALIIDEDTPSEKGNYYYMDITTHPQKSKAYIPLDVPVNKRGDRSYVRKYVGHQKKKAFSKWLLKYKIDDRDMQKIERYLKSKKRQKK